jgi:hypothetical protein
MFLFIPLDSPAYRAGDKKERRMVESQAPLLQINQFFVYLRDHLLLDKSVDAFILMSLLRTPGAIFAVATPKREETRLIHPAYRREGRKSDRAASDRGSKRSRNNWVAGI